MPHCHCGRERGEERERRREREKILTRQVHFSCTANDFRSLLILMRQTDKQRAEKREKESDSIREGVNR